MTRVLFELPAEEKEWLAGALSRENLEYRQVFRAVIRRWMAMTEEERRVEFLALKIEFVKVSIEQKRDEIAILERGLQKG